MRASLFFTLLLLSFTVLGQKFHTKYEYSDSINSDISLENSYPKGGQKYTAPDGKEYVFVVFWSRITNKSISDLEVEVNLSPASFTVPTSTDVNFSLYLPSEEMTLEKDPLKNYGLDIKAFLEENIGKPSKLNKTISPNDSQLLYMVAVSDKGVEGVVRAGFELSGQKLVYKINGHKIECGRIEIKRKNN